MSKSNQQYTEEQLVSFGNYLLSQERVQSQVNGRPLTPAERETLLSEVQHADIMNWLHSKNQAEK